MQKTFKFIINILIVIFFTCFTIEINAAQIHTKCLIIGSGPAGLTAAIHTARAGLNPTLITGKTPGGQLTLITQIENYPGFIKPLDGFQLIQQIIGQAKRLGVNIVNDHVAEVKLNTYPFTCFTENNNEYKSDSLIIATGAQSHWLGIPGEKKFKGHGVSSCPTCDGFFYKNKNVAVVGGGNTAIKDALSLAHFTKQVTLIYSGDKLLANKTLQNKLLSNKKIKVILNTMVEEIVGTEKPLRVTGLKIKNLQNKKTQTLSIEGVFVAIEHTPRTTIFKNVIKLDKAGYIITSPDSTQTNINGVFAAGDVQDQTYRYAVTAIGSGCMAALEAEQYLHYKALSHHTK